MVPDGTSGAFPGGGSYDNVQIYIKAPMAAMSGLYIIRTTGTDDNYAPCNVNAQHPCAMAAGAPHRHVEQLA